MMCTLYLISHLNHILMRKQNPQNMKKFDSTWMWILRCEIIIIEFIQFTYKLTNANRRTHHFSVFKWVHITKHFVAVVTQLCFYLDDLFWLLDFKNLMALLLCRSEWGLYPNFGLAPFNWIYNKIKQTFDCENYSGKFGRRRLKWEQRICCCCFCLVFLQLWMRNFLSHCVLLNISNSKHLWF